MQDELKWLSNKFKTMHPDIAASLAIPSASRLTLWKQACRQIEALIQDGTLRPGQRLPEHTELARMIGVGASTLQRALVDLTNRGLLVRSPRRGTFVAGPEDAAAAGGRHVAILTRALYDPSLSRYDFLTARAVVDLLAGEKRNFKFYSNLTSTLPEAAGYFNEALAGDIQAGAVEGIIVLGSIPTGCDPLLALIARKKVPMVETSAESRPQNLVEFDMDAFYEVGAKLAREGGVRGVGLVSTSLPGRNGHDPKAMFDRHFGPRHFRLEKKNALIASPEPTNAAHLRVGALAAARMADDLPEMVLVTDDYIAEGFVRKMQALGKRPPRDFRLVARGNAGADYSSLEGCEMVLFSPAELVAQVWIHLRSRMGGDRSNRISVAIPPSEVCAPFSVEDHVEDHASTAPPVFH